MKQVDSLSAAQPNVICDHFLQQLNQLLKKAHQSVDNDQSVDNNKHAETQLLSSALQPDMFALAQQVATCSRFALRICFPIADKKVPEVDIDESSIAGLQSGIAEVRKLIAELPPAALDELSQQTLSEQAGVADVELPGDQFCYLYGLPNFFFHLNMVYAILRLKGVPVSKADYDGFHTYPEGFSFL